MAPAEKVKAIPQLVITSDRAVNEDRGDAKVDRLATDAVKHHRRGDYADRYHLAATAQTPFGVDEIDEEILVK